ncbi:YqgE/AlgH family protein [Tessaracoccus lubricantis]|uniref:YqgE/AlgH family protein n=1 Tax=Tessaracoccus lubricantis TaxID=545543 RepID=A0ABP9FMY2_9ACTN
MHTGAIAVGQLLVATQPGRGGYFDRSVVLLLEHHQEGTVGVCLNMFSEMPPEAAAGQFVSHLSPPGVLFEGGPVNSDVVLALGKPAADDVSPPGWERVAGDVGLVDLRFPGELLASSFTALRLFVGLSSWSPGQLEGELIRGSWFRTEVRSDDVFGNPEGLWRRVLRRMGGLPGRWSTWTEEPTLN